MKTSRRPGQQAELQGDHDGLHLRADAQAFVERANVGPHRVHAEAERRPDVVVAVTVREESQDLALAVGDQVGRHDFLGPHGGHLTRAPASAPEHEPRDWRRHGETSTEELPHGVRQAKRLVVEEIAGGARLDQLRDAALADGLGNDERGRVTSLTEILEVDDGARRRFVESNDHHVRPLDGELAARGVERIHGLDTDRRPRGERTTCHASVELDDKRVGKPTLRGSHQTSGTVRQNTAASQGPLTSFELDTQFKRETLRIQRLGRLVGVEFWSIFDTDRRRTIVSKAFSATLLIAGRSKGRAQGWARGQDRLLEGGAVQLSEPGEVQHLGAEGGPVSLFVVRWSEEALQAAAARLGLPQGLQWNSAFLSADKYTASMDQLFTLLNEGAPAEDVESAYAQVTTDLLLSAGTGAFPKRHHGGHPTIRRAIEKMKSGLSETASLDELAAQARLSKFHFARSFRKTTGLAPHQYRKLLRVEQARRMLEGGLSVTDTAQQMGFSDASHLVRSFRDCLGVAPGVWAKAWRASDPNPDHTPTTILPPAHGSERHVPAAPLRAAPLPTFNETSIRLSS